jgi:hypothetical protein
MEVVGLRGFFGTIKPKKLNPEYARVAVGMVLERRTSMDRSNDKAKFSEKYPNESGRPIWLAGSVLGNRCQAARHKSGYRSDSFPAMGSTSPSMALR